MARDGMLRDLPGRSVARRAARGGQGDIHEAALAAVMALPAVRPGVVSRTLVRIAQRRLPPPAPELSASVIAGWWPTADAGGRDAGSRDAGSRDAHDDAGRGVGPAQAGPGTPSGRRP